MLILGINAYHAEASAALVRDGQLVAAAEEERFVRIKHVAGFPIQAIRYCLAAGQVAPEDLDAIAISRNPMAHLWVKGWQALRRGLFSRGTRDRMALLTNLRSFKAILAEAIEATPEQIRAPIHFVEHHRAHIASSFYPSGWETAVLLSLDGFGDFLSGMWGVGQGNSLCLQGEVAFPHSLGVLYTTITQFLGFQSWGDEYKVMGLAAYGNPGPYRRAFETLVHQTPQGGYRLGLEYYRHPTMDVSMSWAAGAPTLDRLFTERLENLLGTPRDPAAPIEKRHTDIAAALQERLEQVILSLLRRLSEKYRTPRLCYAGGVALNCVLNGKIRRETPFRDVFIQPAAHDAGTSLGAALYVAHQIYRQPRSFIMKHTAWGPETTEADYRKALEKGALSFRRFDPEALCEITAEALAQGKIIGWYQGRMEFGPRALGHRSLLADPRDPKMKDRINERVKRRESFRPFAPSVLTEKVGDYFPEGHPDPFMLFAYPVRSDLQKKIPAVVHADGTGRLQAVDPTVEPLYWKLINAFAAKTGVPMLLNTSFNEQEPIVCRPEEAIACFQRNAIDCLALGPFWIQREARS
ncbi:MAG: carbamoyltransferase [Candidatus Omnitrophica bacterium]|nr:carbamoyltransferase [Candidatus Omnitrophota bacterium]